MFKLDHLPHKQRDEEVIFLLRRDHIILFRMLAWYVFLLLLPLILKYWGLDLLPLNSSEPSEVTGVTLTLLTFGYYLFTLLFFYRSWLDYYLDAWVVTNHRILSIELDGLFNRTVSELKLFRIQDVTTEQVGLMAHFFHYGNVHVQTAAAKQRFIFEEVSEPEKVAQRIVQLIEWNRKAYPDERS